jgi:hypothetical protein
MIHLKRSGYADLDNDGDLISLQIILNSVASVYINKTDAKSNYLKIKLEYEGLNTLWDRYQSDFILKVKSSLKS